MSKLIERLRDASCSGVYRAARVEPIMEATRGSALSVVKIRAQGKEALLKDIAAALNFPEWFGGNWDALEDCLFDLSWRNAVGHLLVFEDASPGDDLGVLIDVLRAAAQYWAERGRPFFAVFVDPARLLALPDLFVAK